MELEMLLCNVRPFYRCVCCHPHCAGYAGRRWYYASPWLGYATRCAQLVLRPQKGTAPFTSSQFSEEACP